ncbi:glycoside hydrolase family 16 protein [Pisolithus marmoratus]|nr:glycoside hydrolase family 16 protein [Pisolithus marmoratus]
MQLLSHVAFVLAATLALTPQSTSALRSSLISRAQKIAVRHSTGLARDLRIAFGGILVSESQSDSGQKAYCVSPSSGSSLPTTSSNTSFANGHAPPSSTKSSAPTASASSSPWKPLSTYSGSTFFNDWSFYTSSDPTHGTVQYLSQSDAQNAGLVEINSAGHAVMRVDTTPTVSTNRNSVRITTNLIFTEGLVMLDAVHMPTGCATWPGEQTCIDITVVRAAMLTRARSCSAFMSYLAFWTNGPNWPAGGEIDIIEGVNNYTNNQATIHTSDGCALPTSDATQLSIAGTVVGGTNCAADQTNNEGCGVRSNYNYTFGSGFNSISGGVYAMLWQDSGIQVYFFPRGSIPSDITAGAPQPQTWSTPMANWPSTDCDMASHFYNHSVIFDTTLCGDWAGTAWNGTGVPGQSESCSQLTGYSSCSDFVLNSGASFAEAYWEVSSVKIYQYQS